MKDDWFDENFAERWDADNVRGNPTRPEQLDILTSIVADNYVPGKAILDMGFGSGQVEALIFDRVPEARIVGVDSSEPMIAQAKDRLAEFADNLHVIQEDIPTLNFSELPEENYQIAVGAQVFHEIPDNKRKRVFQGVYNLLDEGGLFLVLDRFDVDFDTLSDCYASVWNRLERITSVKSGKTYEDYRDAMKNKGDEVVPVERYIDLLTEAGFHAAILHLHLNRALIGGVKK